MIARIVAVVLLVALAAFVLMKRQEASVEPEAPQDTVEPEFQKADVEGVVPDITPRFDVEAALHDEGPRKVITFTVTERHGWYADEILIQYWKRERDESGEWKRVTDRAPFLARKYLDFNSTMVDSTTLYVGDFLTVEDWGTDENWAAIVGKYGRVLAPKEGASTGGDGK